jgi:hypothetical protein
VRAAHRGRWVAVRAAHGGRWVAARAAHGGRWVVERAAHGGRWVAERAAHGGRWGVDWTAAACLDCLNREEECTGLYCFLIDGRDQLALSKNQLNETEGITYIHLRRKISI